MRLSKIRLSGFKSFVDPTTIHFPSNLMGIVGPNGCGKSNVIDAIRWVLGESSAKTLRGDSMADVIFNGSSNRKPVGQASIELHFDNSDGKITGAYAGFSEVSVRRVVTRDGTSQYYLNNAKCRRKDITHLLLGTGVGSHGYSIIEQGMISRLVEAKPEELRAFLEEAAGISKFKERRRETEHRIQHTRENLERLSDLREEVDKQLAHLKRQARAAERYKELKTEQRRVTAELLVLKLHARRAEATRQEELLKSRQLALAAAETALQSVDAEIEKLRVASAESNERFNEVQGSYYRVGSDIARLEQQIKHRKDTVQRQQQDLDETVQQLDEISGHIADDQVAIEQLDRVLSELSPELEQAYARQRESEAALQQAEEQLERFRERWDSVAAELADTQRGAQVEEARIEQLTAQGERLDRSRREQAAERDAISSADVEQELESLIAGEESLRDACREALQSVNTASEHVRQLKSREAEQTRRLDEWREQLQNDRGRLSSLEALQEAAIGGVSPATEQWLAARDLGRRARLAEQLTVERGWERAVETVLGDYLQAIGVERIDGLLDGIGGIGDGGIALLETAAEPPARTMDGDRLADKVDAPGAARGLLAGVLTAPSLEAAIAMRERLGDGQSVITAEGIWLGRHWVRVNANDDPQVGVIARGEEIQRLRGTVRCLSADVDEVGAAQADTRRRIAELEAARDAGQAELNERQAAHTEAKSALEAKRARLEQIRSRSGALARGIAELDDERRGIALAIEESRGRLRAAEARRDALSGDREGLERERDRHQARVAEARMQADEDRESVQAMALKVESRKSSKESASAALDRVLAQQRHLQRRRGELEAHIASSLEPLAGEESALREHLDRRLAVERELNDARAEVEGIDERLRAAQLQRTDRQAEVAAAREEADTVRLTVREAQVRADTVAEQFQATGFALDVIVAELPDGAKASDWEESLEQIERRINRLGPINMSAIGEFDEQSERKQYLDTQYKDLTDALETLENAIRKIDRETRSKFKDTFDKANQGLSRLFPRLFGGGHAYLELTGDDLLNSGVTVMARPPGKKISTIHLLSGGEKALTAVALVFSIFELNPAPFCLLDEVDAPLDDANVGRFSEIVKEMSDQVQFVLITHNKTTMEAMSQLTGVTMHEPGVSRLVAVDIDEAVQLAAM